MVNFTLWNQLAELQSYKYRWVDLTHEFSPDTPIWVRFKHVWHNLLSDTSEARMKEIDLFAPALLTVPALQTASGTITEAKLNECNTVYPLCVIDVHEKVEKDSAYALTKADIDEFEEKFGPIPEGAFVAMRSDWHKRWPDQEKCLNRDEKDNSHYPGWDIDALKFLFEVRKVSVIGHETLETDPPACQPQHVMGEDYVLRQDKIQIELMSNLDQVPPVGSIICCILPKFKDITGFMARCFAICPVTE